MKSEEYKLILHLRKQSSKKKIEEKQSRFLSFKPARKNINYFMTQVLILLLKI